MNRIAFEIDTTSIAAYDEDTQMARHNEK